MHIAAARGFVQILDLYLSQYPFVVDWVDSRGATPLHLAAMTGEAEAARILIDYAGPDLVDAPDLFGSTPLHYASSYGKLSVSSLRSLMKLHGALDDCHHPPFSRAMLTLLGDQVCKLLVEQDCDVTTRNNEGFTAGDYAFS